MAVDEARSIDFDAVQGVTTMNQDKQQHDTTKTASDKAIHVDAMVMRQTGIYCVPEFSSETEEEAWEEFIKKFKFVCTWYRGNKYWRVAPELNSQVDFETGKKEYRVYARMMTFLDEKPRGINEAIFDHNGVTYRWNDYTA